MRFEMVNPVIEKLEDQGKSQDAYYLFTGLLRD